VRDRVYVDLSFSIQKGVSVKRHLAVGAPLGILRTNSEFALRVEKACLPKETVCF